MNENESQLELKRQEYLDQMINRIISLSQFTELSDGESKELVLKLAKVLVSRNALSQGEAV
jgi:hypothetical protein